MPAEAAPLELSAEACAPMLPRRAADSHKGSHGTLICVCGSLDFAGAALLCGMAAARAGAGLVALAVPSSLQPLFAGRVADLVTLGLPETTKADVDAGAALTALDAWSPDGLVFGSGVRESEGYGALLERLIQLSGPAMVVDGGGLNLLARSPGWSARAARALVLTPHPGEFERLTGTPAGATSELRSVAARRAAAEFGQLVVLKGARTVIAAPDGRLAVSPFANAALATAGSGDVLAGLIGGFLTQGVAPFEAACLGVFIHGRAGERISERLGDAGLLASDLPLEAALARYELAARG